MSLSFDATFYQAQRPDVYNAFVATAGSTGQTWAEFAQVHYNTFGRFEGSDPNARFDTSFYLSQYPDVAAAGVNPFDHFISFGSAEVRMPFSTFPTSSFVEADYLAANSDVQDAVTAGTYANGYQHWVLFGQFETRTGAPTVTTPTQPGETFTMTTGLDFASTSNAFINGTILSDFRFSDSSETVEALAGTMNTTDTLIDASVTDTDVVNIRGFDDTVATHNIGTLTNIEEINFISPANVIGQSLATVTGAKSLSVAGTSNTVAFTNAGGTGITTYDFSGITNSAGAVTLTHGTTTPTDALSITGGAGGDTLNGGNGADTILGGGGGDTLIGAAGDDMLTGGAGTDTLTGGAGNDTFTIDAGTDTINDLATGDIVTIASGTTLLTAAGSVSDFVATSATTNEGTAATINTAASASTVDVSAAGGSKGWTINGGNGKDTLTGSANADVIATGAGGGTVTGGGGKDAITLGAGSDVVAYGAGDSGLTTATADTIAAFTSGVGNDQLKLGLAGTAGNTTLANDVVTGGVTTVEAAVTAANAAFNGTVRYYYDDNGAGTNGFLVWDSDGDGSADGAVQLTGIGGATNTAGILVTDIIA